MKPPWKILVVFLAILGVAGGMIFALEQRRQEPAEEGKSEKQTTPAPDTERSTGESGVSIDQDRQKLIGLETAIVKPFTLPRQTKAYGNVLEPQPLVGLLAD